MRKGKSRQLNTFQLAEHFLIKVLGLEITEENYDMIPKIVETELNIENFDDFHDTKSSKAYRNYFVRDDVERSKLRTLIVQELITKTRLSDDESISLGKGGSAPNGDLQQNFDAYILIGLPASGKSTVSNLISESYGCFVLDSDYAKRKIPEFHGLQFGASLVHEEATDLIFGEEKITGTKSVLEYVAEYGINCVIPKIGSEISSILNLQKILNLYNYNAHLILVELDRVLATKRALKRFMETKRYVPLGLIFDDYSNNPSITYYKIKSEHFNKFKSFGIISTNVNTGENFKVIENTEESPLKIFKK